MLSRHNFLRRTFFGGNLFNDPFKFATERFTARRMYCCAT